MDAALVLSARGSVVIGGSFMLLLHTRPPPPSGCAPFPTCVRLLMMCPLPLTVYLQAGSAWNTHAHLSRLNSSAKPSTHLKNMTHCSALCSLQRASVVANANCSGVTWRRTSSCK